MIIRKANDRGVANFDWLKSRHTFSFGHYYDPEHMGFGPLRVINDDRVVAGQGFPPHGHIDMEIISYVLDGALAHKDSLGTGSIIRPGEVQRMSAGTGIRHSEYNHSSVEPLRFLQIWIEPAKRGIDPGYEQKVFPPELRRGQWQLMVSPHQKDAVITINQDIYLLGLLLDGIQKQEYTLANDRCAWLHLARGEVVLNGEHLEEGDGVAIDGGSRLSLSKGRDAEILLFDMTGRNT